MKALVFCLVALAAYKAQGLTLSKPNRNIKSAAATIAASAIKENEMLDSSALRGLNATEENQLRIEIVAANIIRGLFNEAESLKNKTMNILTKHSINTTRLSYDKSLRSLIAINNVTEMANAFIINAINDMKKKGYTIKNQTIEEIQSKSQNLTLTFYEDLQKAIEKMEAMKKSAHEVIDKSITTLQTDGDSIKHKTIDELELASKNLTSIYQKSVEEARQNIEDMKISAQKMITNFIETIGTEKKAFQEDTIKKFKLQANNITEMFHKNINETTAQVDIAIKQKNEQALASIEEVWKKTHSGLYKETEGARKNFSDHLHNVQQSLKTELDLKVQQIDDDVVEKIENAINELEERETQLESNLDLKKKEILEELEKKNNKTKFEEELKSIKNSFINSVNKSLENSEELFLKKFISAITETTKSKAKVFEGALGNELKEYNRLLKKNKALYVMELKMMKKSIEAALRVMEGSSTTEDCEDTVELDVDASEDEVKENNNKHAKEILVPKTEEPCTCYLITLSKNEAVESNEPQIVSVLTKIDEKSNVSASTDEQISASESEIGKKVILNGKKVSYSEKVPVKSSNESSIISTSGTPEVNTRSVEKDDSSASPESSESSSNETDEAKIESIVPMGEKTHDRKKSIEKEVTTRVETVYYDGVENKNTTTPSSSKNITLSSGDNTPATSEHSQIDLKTNATATSTTEAEKIESTTEAKTTKTTTVASVDNVEQVNNAIEKTVEVDPNITKKISIQYFNESSIVGTTEKITRPVEKDGLSASSVSSESSSNKTEEAKIESVVPMC
ncbi:putative leucine-rich repeat-containing protein DDB_G0290503 [Cotesia glomerata]|nr:putative leucine-rich repeat-containing protein DDB_G0290503 [Cotesia glomerata]